MHFELEFEFFQGINWPVLEFSGEVLTVNDTVLSEYHKRVNIKIDPKGNILTFNNTNKNDYDTIVEDGKIIRDQSIKLNNIWVDDILLNLNLVLSNIQFIPNYKDGFLKFCQENNIVVDYNPYPFALFHNGCWKFSFEIPFWEWYSRQRQHHVNKNFSNTEIEMYIGKNYDSTKNDLIKLKKLLDV